MHIKGGTDEGKILAASQHKVLMKVERESLEVEVLAGMLTVAQGLPWSN